MTDTRTTAGCLTRDEKNKKKYSEKHPALEKQLASDKKTV